MAHDEPTPTQHTVLRHAERLDAQARTVETERISLVKDVTTRQEQVPVSRRREVLVVETDGRAVPGLDRVVAESGGSVRVVGSEGSDQAAGAAASASGDRPSSTGPATPGGRPGSAGAGTPVVLHEERAEAQPRTVPYERLTVQRRVETRTESVTAPVRTEQVDVVGPDGRPTRDADAEPGRAD